MWLLLRDRFSQACEFVYLATLAGSVVWVWNPLFKMSNISKRVPKMSELRTTILFSQGLQCQCNEMMPPNQEKLDIGSHDMASWEDNKGKY
jgi:hypothetical protein